jgi:hypothetical protein
MRPVLPGLLALLLAACTPGASPAEPPGSPPAEPSAAADKAPETAGPPAESASAPASPSAPDTRAIETDRPATQIRLLTAEERAAMTGVSWHPGCPVPLEDLRAVELRHHTPDGGTARGLLVVHADAADDMVTAFEALYEAGFPITRMEPVRAFGGDDAASMAADNTSGFNCRPVAGGRSWSQHALGRAVDLNPLRNPWVKGERVQPPGGRDWLDRDDRPGVITADGPAVEAFRRVGWRWGGHWRSLKDYQHFSANGR